MGNKLRLGGDVIRDAAVELVREIGLGNLTINLLAEKLGVRPPSLYNHLSGIKELQEKVAAFSLQCLEVAVRDAAVGKSGAEALLRIAEAYRKFALENSELYKSMLLFPGSADSNVKEAGMAVARIIYQVLERYGLSEEDQSHYARGFRSLVHGFVSLEEVGFFKSGDRDKSFRLLVKGFISTLGARE
ncbi:MAG: TetR family transcriptional regulator [Spirochaetales bacterium]|nr:TetR family transcriptional regulator [Spirochaetales bacterium]